MYSAGCAAGRPDSDLSTGERIEQCRRELAASSVVRTHEKHLGPRRVARTAGERKRSQALVAEALHEQWQIRLDRGLTVQRVEAVLDVPGHGLGGEDAAILVAQVADGAVQT